MMKTLSAQTIEISDYKMQHNLRYVPLVQNLKIRSIIGFILLVLSVTLAGTIYDAGRIGVIISIAAFAWLPAVFLTDKYVHKYPQRYFTYIIASHLKAAIIMLFLLWIMGRIASLFGASQDALWSGYMFFILADALASVPRRRDIPDRHPSLMEPTLGTENIAADPSSDSGHTNTGLSSIDKQAIVNQFGSDLDKPLVEFIEKNLPALQDGTGDVLLFDDIPIADNQPMSAPVSLLVGRTRLNQILRLNQFFQFCVKRITMGGYFVVQYIPLENFANDLNRHYSGLPYWTAFIFHYLWYRAFPKIPWLDILYFSPMLSWLDTLHLSLTKKRNRVLSKAEAWGRLSYYGMQVIAESKGDGEIYLLAQRVASPVQRRPSFYPVVALEKMGLNGEIIHAHKIRTMFPFSEFIQKRIFEDHGLASNGKFSDDFRLTGFGKFLRKYWLDELPQIFDWLSGDIKLVGIRATSRHFLSLYPKKFLDLYFQIKPGLIPPIFDETTNGFDQIVEVELTYLQSHREQPIRTDVRYFIQTFTDIVFKGVRSH